MMIDDLAAKLDHRPSGIAVAAARRTVGRCTQSA
jgi:hypothetical protein